MCYEPKLGKVNIASANQTVCYVSNGSFSIIEGDIFAIGDLLSVRKNMEFQDHHLDIEQPFSIYMFTDGYQDQLGEEQKKKFMTGEFLKLLKDISKIDLDKQYKILDQRYLEWKGNNDQSDDILIIGVAL